MTERLLFCRFCEIFKMAKTAFTAKYSGSLENYRAKFYCTYNLAIWPNLHHQVMKTI